LDESLGAFPKPMVANQLLFSSVHELKSSHHSDLTAVFLGLESGGTRFQTVINLSYTKHSFGSNASLNGFTQKIKLIDLKTTKNVYTLMRVICS
jgi:hypothetical protein